MNNMNMMNNMNNMSNMNNINNMNMMNNNMNNMNNMNNNMNNMTNMNNMNNMNMMNNNMNNMNNNMNNMNMMNNMNNMNNNMNNNNYMFGMNMNMNNNNNFGMNNMYNNGMNMANYNNNCLNINMLKCLYEQFKNQNNGYSMQLGIALGLNNNKPYNNFLKPPSYAFLRTSSKDNNFSNFGDPDIINVVFAAMRSNRHARVYKKSQKVNDILIGFLKSVGLNENALGKIQFIFNATNLNHVNKDVTLQQCEVKNNSIIYVVDRTNVIGA
jgi:hypothetical protein